MNGFEDGLDCLGLSFGYRELLIFISFGDFFLLPPLVLRP